MLNSSLVTYQLIKIMLVMYAFLLIFTFSLCSPDELKCSVTNKSIIKNTELPIFTYCEDSSYPILESGSDLSKAINYVNNSTGLISLDIPTNPFGLLYRRPMKHTVKLFHCNNHTSASCELGEQHQQYTFYSRAIRCANGTSIPRNTAILFHNVWSDSYKLSILHGNTKHVYYTFNATTNFTKPPEISKNNIFFVLSKTRDHGLEARFGTTDQFGPPLNQMALLIFNHSNFNCQTIRSVAEVYINTTFVTEHCRNTVTKCYVECENKHIQCAAISDREIQCYFFNLSLSDDLNGLLLFDNDVRCRYNAYGELRYNKCCVKAATDIFLADR